MENTEMNKSRYHICLKKNQETIGTGISTLLEDKSLADITLRCGTNNLLAHKVILAANSPLFKERLEKNDVEQVIVDAEYSVIKCLIEFIYCGETRVDQEQMNYFLAAAKLFQIKCLDSVAKDFIKPGDEQMIIPKLEFIYKDTNQNSPNEEPNRRLPQPYVDVTALSKASKSEARYEQIKHLAALQMAEASRLGLAKLKRELALAPLENHFIIQEPCGEAILKGCVQLTNMEAVPRIGQIVATGNEGAKCDFQQNFARNEFKFPLAESSFPATSSKVCPAPMIVNVQNQSNMCIPLNNKGLFTNTLAQ